MVKAPLNPNYHGPACGCDRCLGKNCPKCDKPRVWSNDNREWACSDRNCPYATGPAKGGGWPV